MQIIVEKRSDWTNYWDASTPEAFANSCVAILKSRLRDQDIIEPCKPDNIKDYRGTPILSIEEIEAIPEVARKPFVDAYKYKQRLVREYEEDLKGYQEAKRIVEENDTSFTNGRRSVPIAWLILEARADYEYEGVSLETVFQPGINDE